MATIKFKKSTLSDAHYISEHIRESDRNELACHNQTPLSALIAGLEQSDDCTTMFVDGKPTLMFGITSTGILSSTGVIWALGTSDTFKAPRTMVKFGRKFVGIGHEKYDSLCNIVDARNTDSIKWLSMIGFTVNKKQPVKVGGFNFYHFLSEV